MVVAVVAIALPDSVNPFLIVADLLFASGPRPARDTVAFTLAAFTVTFVAGLALALGLGSCGFCRSRGRRSSMR